MNRFEVDAAHPLRIDLEGANDVTCERGQSFRASGDLGETCRPYGGGSGSGHSGEAPSTGPEGKGGRFSTFRLSRDFEPIARWGVPTALVMFLVVLVAISFSYSIAEQERIVAGATADVELAAAVIADEIDMRLREQPGMAPADILARSLPRHALSRGQRVFLSDQSGTIIASFPDLRASGSIIDHVGASQALTVFAEKAGVMRLTLPSGVQALATSHALQGSFAGLVTIVHPLDDVLGDWRTGVYRTLILLATTGAVLAALALAYFSQVTKARQADSSCRIMRDRVDMVLSSGRCGLWDWDLASGYIDWSVSMFEILGMTPRSKTVPFREVNALVHPDDISLAEIARRLASGTQNSIDQMFRMRGGDGGWVWLRAKAELVQDDGAGPHIIGIAIDVTETMALEERTARADMRLRDAIETISEAFVVWDAENRLVMCNSKFQRFHDLPADAVVVGTPYAAVMERGRAPLIQSQVVLGETQPMGARTFEARLGDGRWLQINERRTKDGGYVSVGTDITALKRNEEQLIESERRLMSSVVDLRKSRQILETQAQQLAELAEKYLEQKAEAENANRAKSDFLANMGHELRTPLNAILGFSEIMILESFGPLGSTHYAEYCRDIHASGQYLLGVIADVLEMSHLEAGRVRLATECFVVEDAIQAAAKAVADVAADKSITIAVERSRGTQLLADRTAVEKVLTILLNNAVKYTPAQGGVKVRSRALNGSLNIYVEDSGIGIPPEALDRLGRPFEQSDKGLKNGMRGSGLGLAIARSLVDLHGGSMRIQSKDGVGTTVLVQLPNRHSAPRPDLQLATKSLRAEERVPRLAIQNGGRLEAQQSRIA